MPHPGLLYPEPLTLWQATADPYLRRKHSNSQRHFQYSISVGSTGAHKVLFLSLLSLSGIWGLILYAILLLLPCFWGFAFALGCGVSFFGGIQHSAVNGCSAAVVILEFSLEKMSTHLSNLPSWSGITWLLLLLSHSVVSNSVQPQRRQPTRLPRPWDSPGN